MVFGADWCIKEGGFQHESGVWAELYLGQSPSGISPSKKECMTALDSTLDTEQVLAAFSVEGASLGDGMGHMKLP